MCVRVRVRRTVVRKLSLSVICVGLGAVRSWPWCLVLLTAAALITPRQSPPVIDVFFITRLVRGIRDVRDDARRVTVVPPDAVAAGYRPLSPERFVHLLTL